MKMLLTVAGLALGLSTSISLVAQQTTTPQTGQSGEQGQEKPFGRHGGRKHRRGMGGMRGDGMRALGQLNLTEAQKAQIKTIHEAAQQRTQSQREELRQLFQSRQGGAQLSTEQETRAKQLMSELRTNHENTHQEVLRVLTDEQKVQLEKIKQERKSHRGEKRGPRRQRDNTQQF